MIKRKKTKDKKQASVVEQVPGFDKEIGSAYWNRQEEMSPQQYFRNVKLYWGLAILMMVLSCVFFEVSLYVSTSKNEESVVSLLRIDGLVVEEALDVRRDALFEATLRRNQLINNMGQTTTDAREGDGDGN
jgi:hypothetical protein